MELKKICDLILEETKIYTLASYREKEVKNKVKYEYILISVRESEDLFFLVESGKDKLRISNMSDKYKKEVSYFNKKNSGASIEEIVEFLVFIELLEARNPLERFYLEAVELENYRKYDSQRIDFQSMFNLIIGENATGKTTILEGIATSLGGFLQGISSIRSSETHSIKARDMKRDYVSDDSGIRSVPKENTVVKGEYTVNESSISWSRYLKNIKGKTSISKVLDYEVFSLADSLTEERSDVILPLFSYHGTGRVWEQDNKVLPKMEKLSRIDGYKGCLEARSNYKSFLSWFEKLERHSFNVRRVNPLLESVKGVIIKTIEKLTNDDIVGIIYREGDLEIDYFNGEIASVGLMSDGYRNIIGLVSDIAYRIAILNPNVKDPINNTPGVVLIDELDLHLHPKWQMKIVGILRGIFPKIQFIATSHSPFITQSMKSEEIIRLEEDAAEIFHGDASMISIEDVAENIMDVDVPQMSERKKLMFEAAKKYYDILDKIVEVEISKKEIEELKKKLEKLSEPFEENVAYSAFLERKRLVAESKLVK